jgi:L-alanine-DL-glutamate epimerase-like enolase superfamily enzyme
MNISNNSKYNRRGVLKSTLGLLAGGLIGPLAEKAEAQPALQHVNRNSNPSQLKITDLRYTVVKKPGPSPCPIIRIDTNQGVYGLGEVRDVANYQYAMVLKSRIMGENPLNVDFLFEKIAQFGGISRQAGGVVAVEMALWDIVGKVYNIPIYQLLGGKWRDKIRIYADTPEADTPQEFAAIAKERKDRGLTWIKVDVGTDLL